MLRLKADSYPHSAKKRLLCCTFVIGVQEWSTNSEAELHVESKQHQKCFERFSEKILVVRTFPNSDIWSRPWNPLAIQICRFTRSLYAFKGKSKPSLQLLFHTRRLFVTCCYPCTAAYKESICSYIWWVWHCVLVKFTATNYPFAVEQCQKWATISKWREWP